MSEDSISPLYSSNQYGRKGAPPNSKQGPHPFESWDEGRPRNRDRPLRRQRRSGVHTLRTDSVTQLTAQSATLDQLKGSHP